MTETEKWLDLKEDLDQKDKIKNLRRQRDILLSFFGTVAKWCSEHTKGVLLTKPDSIKRKVVDYSFHFNVHNFTTYYSLNIDFFDKIKTDGKDSSEFVDKWNKYFNEVLLPIYLEELELIKEESEKEEKFKSVETVDYIR